tara:strand:- start:407 stop:1012 length:606 start_codon:yes stop_codon:yes gene_type:complete
MSKKMLLREYYALCEGGACQDLLTEAEKAFVANGGVMLSGRFQTAGVKNGNGRMYSRPILEREMKSYHKLVQERRALGELDHPEDSVINLKNASHLVTDVWWDGDDVMGKVEVLNTPSGNILKGLVESGVKMGISSRGLGTVTESDDVSEVNDDFQLICFDFVSEPSTPGAFMMKEAKNHESNTFNRTNKIDRLINDILGN